MNMPAQVSKENGAKTRRPRTSSLPRETPAQPLIIHAESTGEWMPADELHQAALAALQSGNDVIVDVDRIDHLDASALQVLLALDSELTNHNKNLRVANVSAHLLKWFQYAGADDRFFLSGQNNNE